MDKAKTNTILVTGCNGLIGSSVVTGLLDEGYFVIGLDKSDQKIIHERYKHIAIDLADANALENVFEENAVERVIHLAALAHKGSEKDLSYSRHYHVNVSCAQNIFTMAAKRQIPLLFSSTADVYGFVKGVANAETEPNPIGPYARTKYLAEKELQRICKENSSNYTIFRFAPVYTDEIKRDIQKRYYLRYPNWAYIIGKGTEYESLYIGIAVQRIADWVLQVPSNNIVNVKDEKMMSCLLYTSRCV